MKTYVCPWRAGEEWEVFYDDGDGVRSLQGWYYEDESGLLCGPFYSERAAEQHSQEAQDYEGC